MTIFLILPIYQKFAKKHSEKLFWYVHQVNIYSISELFSSRMLILVGRWIPNVFALSFLNGDESKIAFPIH